MGEIIHELMVCDPQRVIDTMSKFFSMTEKSFKQMAVKSNGQDSVLGVRRLAYGPIVRASGEFSMSLYEVSDQWAEYSVVLPLRLVGEDYLPDFDASKPIALRIDSGCSTGQVFGDLTCDCHEQLVNALDYISTQEQGMVIHIASQDGRGAGHGDKLKTLYAQRRLQISTVDAATILHGDAQIDFRTYEGVVAILKSLNIGNVYTIDLLSNNVLKKQILEENQYRVTSKSIGGKVTPFNRHHLESKKAQLGHEGILDKVSS